MSLGIFDYLFVALITAISVVVVVEDLARKKIPNVVIVRGFVAGSFLQVVGLIGGAITIPYLGDVLTNALVSLAVGYLFWAVNFWPAGDAKLFALFAFLLPLRFYWKGYVPFFPSMTMLANIFLCAYAVLIARSFIHLVVLFIRKDPFFTTLIPKTREFFATGKRPGFSKKVDMSIVGRVVLQAAGAIILMHYVFNPLQPWSYDAVKASLFGMAMWMSASLMMKKYIADREVSAVDPDNLRVGMSPLIDPRETETYTKEFLGELGPVRAEGLDERQVGLMRALFDSKSVGSVNIHKNMPFSPWIVVGLLATILLNDSVMRFIGMLLSGEK